MLRPLFLALVLAGTATAFLAEVHRKVTAYDTRESRTAGAIGWQFGIPQVERLQTFLRAARRHLPPGAGAIFASPEDMPGQRFFRYRWASFLLPEVALYPLDDPTAERQVRFLLNYGPRFDHPRLKIIRRLPGGQLYRIRAPRPIPPA
jgi:hypothetical protein